MENQERVEVNSVTYSADSQREMDAIVAKYVKQDAPKQETALDRMQKLDRAAESKAQIVGLAVGIVAANLTGPNFLSRKDRIIAAPDHAIQHGDMDRMAAYRRNKRTL